MSNSFQVVHVVGVRWWSALAAYAVDLARTQARSGRRVAIVPLGGSPVEEAARAHAIPIPLTFGAGATAQVALVRALASRLSAWRTEVVHVHTGLGHLSAEIARARATPRPLLVRTRGDRRRPRATPWARWLYRRADAVVLSGRCLADGILSFGLDEARVFVVLGGVDTDRFTPDRLPDRAAARAALGLPPDTFVAGLVGRLSPVKGHRHAIEAIGRLSGVHLLVTGESSQLAPDDLRSWARAVGIADRLHLRGRLGDVRTALSAIDVGLVASTGSEAIGRVLGEMMASGVPIVATRTGVLPEMVENERTGLLVPPADPGALADAILRIMNDPRAARALGDRAQAHVLSDLTLEGFRARYEEIYARGGAIA